MRLVMILFSFKAGRYFETSAFDSSKFDRPITKGNLRKIEVIIEIISIFVPSGIILYLCFNMFLSWDKEIWNTLTMTIVELIIISLLMIVLTIIVTL